MEPPLPGYYQYFLVVNVSCSRTQHGDHPRPLAPESDALPLGHRAADCLPAFYKYPQSVVRGKSCCNIYITVMFKGEFTTKLCWHDDLIDVTWDVAKSNIL